MMRRLGFWLILLAVIVAGGLGGVALAKRFTKAEVTIVDESKEYQITGKRVEELEKWLKEMGLVDKSVFLYDRRKTLKPPLRGLALKLVDEEQEFQKTAWTTKTGELVINAFSAGVYQTGRGRLEVRLYISPKMRGEAESRLITDYTNRNLGATLERLAGTETAGKLENGWAEGYWVEIE